MIMSTKEIKRADLTQTPARSEKAVHGTYSDYCS